MTINSENRATTWTRSLVAGLGAVAMAATINMGAPQEAKAANCGGGNIILGPNGLADGSSFLACFGNLYAGALNGSGNGNSFGLGASIQIVNAAIGFGNQSADGNGGLLGINLQVGNLAVGAINQSADGNGLLAGINIQAGNVGIGALNQSFDGNGLIGINLQLGNEALA